MKSNKGITLVALVITIIVLLILAGVSISLVVGDNGVLTQAGTAKTKTTNADLEEAFGRAVVNAQSEFVNDGFTGDFFTWLKTNTADLKENGYTIKPTVSGETITGYIYKGGVSDDTDSNPKRSFTISKDNDSKTFNAKVVYSDYSAS